MPGTLPSVLDEEGLDIALHHGAEIIDAPDAVDDRGNSREELDRDADRPTQRRPAELRQEHRDAKADRNRDQHGDQRGDEGAVNRRRRAEFLFGRTPGVGEQKADAEFPERRPRANEQGDQDPEQEHKNENRRAEGQQAEAVVGEFEPPKRAGAIHRRAVGGAGGLQCGCRHRWFQLRVPRGVDRLSGADDGAPRRFPSAITSAGRRSSHIFSTSATTLSGIGM